MDALSNARSEATTLLAICSLGSSAWDSSGPSRQYREALERGWIEKYGTKTVRKCRLTAKGRRIIEEFARLTNQRLATT